MAKTPGTPRSSRAGAVDRPAVPASRQLVAAPTAPSNVQPRANFRTDPHDPRAKWRRLFAEWFGTGLLTLVAAGADVISAATHITLSQPARVVAPGLLVMALIYTIGDVSGAHFNPAVTLAFALRSDFPWSHVFGYWLAQFTGAIAAAGLLRVVFGPVGHLGATLPAPALGPMPAVLMEAVLTMVLVTGHPGNRARVETGGAQRRAGRRRHDRAGGSVCQPSQRRVNESSAFSWPGADRRPARHGLDLFRRATGRCVGGGGHRVDSAWPDQCRRRQRRSGR